MISSQFVLVFLLAISVSRSEAFVLTGLQSILQKAIETSINTTNEETTSTSISTTTISATTLTTAPTTTSITIPATTPTTTSTTTPTTTQTTTPTKTPTTAPTTTPATTPTTTPTTTTTTTPTTTPTKEKDLALYQPAFESYPWSDHFNAGLAVNGRENCAYNVPNSLPNWLVVDLGRPYLIGRIRFNVGFYKEPLGTDESSEVKVLTMNEFDVTSNPPNENKHRLCWRSGPIGETKYYEQNITCAGKKKTYYNAEKTKSPYSTKNTKSTYSAENKVLSDNFEEVTSIPFNSGEIDLNYVFEEIVLPNESEEKSDAYSKEENTEYRYVAVMGPADHWLRVCTLQVFQDLEVVSSSKKILKKITTTSKTPIPIITETKTQHTTQTITTTPTTTTTTIPATQTTFTTTIPTTPSPTTTPTTTITTTSTSKTITSTTTTSSTQTTTSTTTSSTTSTTTSTTTPSTTSSTTSTTTPSTTSITTSTKSCHKDEREDEFVNLMWSFNGNLSIRSSALKNGKHLFLKNRLPLLDWILIGEK